MVEFAIVLPLLLILVLGIIEMGRLMMLTQVTTNACREAVRRAIVPGATQSNVVAVCNANLDAGGISDTGRKVSIMGNAGQLTVVENIGSRQSVTVRVEIPLAENTFGLSTFTGGSNLTAEVTMRRE